MTDDKVIVKQTGASNVAAWTAFGVAALALAKQIGWVGNQFDGFIPAGAPAGFHGGHPVGFGGGIGHLHEENINLKLEVNKLKGEKYTDDKFNFQEKRLDWLTWEVNQLKSASASSSTLSSTSQAA